MIVGPGSIVAVGAAAAGVGDDFKETDVSCCEEYIGPATPEKFFVCWTIVVLDIVDLVEGKHSFIDARPGEARETLADNTKAKTLLGWNPAQRFEDWVEANRPQ